MTPLQSYLPFTISLCLLDSRSRIDFGNFPLLLASTIGLAHVSAQLRRSNIDTGLVSSAFVSFASE